MFLQVLTFVGDLTEDEFRVAVIDKTVEKFGKIDILVNSAGIVVKGTIENTSLEKYDKVMDINVR